jgi:hypothetical protein
MTKKTDSSKNGREQNDKEALLHTLTDLISELDGEEIQFLIHQAQVLQYNKQVRERNKNIADSQSADSSKMSGKTGKASKQPPKQPGVEIVERGEGKHFFIVVRGFRIYFTLDEMRKLVKICHAAGDAADAAHRLYNWFKRFRSDFLVDGDIGSATHPYLSDLYGKLISTYKVQEDG